MDRSQESSAGDKNRWGKADPSPCAGWPQSSRGYASPSHIALGPLGWGTGAWTPLPHQPYYARGVGEAFYRWPLEPHPDLLLLPTFCSPFLFVSLCFCLCLCVTLTVSRHASTPISLSVFLAAFLVILSLCPVSGPHHLPFPPLSPTLPAPTSLISLPIFLGLSPPPSLFPQSENKQRPRPLERQVSRKYREKISNLTSLLLGVSGSGVRPRWHLQRQSWRTRGWVPQMCHGALLLSLPALPLSFSTPVGMGMTGALRIWSSHGLPGRLRGRVTLTTGMVTSPPRCPDPCSRPAL